MGKGSDGQLSLLGADETAPEPSRVASARWARHEAPGGLGFGTLEVSAEELAREASIALVIAETPGTWSEVNLLDVRHLALPLDAAALERHVAALAADVRAGRRACVLAADPTLAPLVVGMALVELGATSEEAVAALGGRSVLGAERHAALVERAVARGRERARDSTPLFAHAREPSPPDPLAGLDERADRLAGAVLGAAIGDAMGHPTELVRSLDAIRERWPPDGVRGYVLFIEDEGRRVAPYTDDTQMAEVVLRALLWGRERDADLDATMTHLAAGLVEWAARPLGGHRAPGNACLSGCAELARGVPWREAGGARAGGCGSVVRAYPFGLVYADDLGRAERWAVEHSKLTHRDPIALAACAAMAVGVARAFRGDPVPLALSEMVAAACRWSPRTGQLMAEAWAEADEGVSPEETLSRLEGWAAHEAIAAAVYLVARHPDDPSSAILEAANTPGDSDSLATLAGALVGARVGARALPRAWIDELERSAALLALAETI
ncbi:MAG: ADP-ribosylglycohydrolase family protein [Sandaracinaceae bacterium]|nr:ADP-ribosylglycohydrolase family protein [Sandaracinaceae bacterium]